MAANTQLRMVVYRSVIVILSVLSVAIFLTPKGGYASFVLISVCYIFNSIGHVQFRDYFYTRPMVQFSIINTAQLVTSYGHQVATFLMVAREFFKAFNLESLIEGHQLHFCNAEGVFSYVGLFPGVFGLITICWAKIISKAFPIQFLSADHERLSKQMKIVMICLPSAHIVIQLASEGHICRGKFFTLMFKKAFKEIRLEEIKELETVPFFTPLVDLSTISLLIFFAMKIFIILKVWYGKRGCLVTKLTGLFRTRVSPMIPLHSISRPLLTQHSQPTNAQNASHQPPAGQERGAAELVEVIACATDGESVQSSQGLFLNCSTLGSSYNDSEPSFLSPVRFERLTPERRGCSDGRECSMENVEQQTEDQGMTQSVPSPSNNISPLQAIGNSFRQRTVLTNRVVELVSFLVVGIFVVTSPVYQKFEDLQGASEWNLIQLEENLRSLVMFVPWIIILSFKDIVARLERKISNFF